MDALSRRLNAAERQQSYGEGHGVRVSIWAVAIACRVVSSDDILEAVRLAGQFHDLGKEACPNALLNKPGPLDAEELRLVRGHALAGWELGRELASLSETTLHAIRHHHEHLDGSGYPDGLAGAAIPIATRIVAIADVYDALSTCHSYKPAFTHETCLRILREEAHRGWWDAELVEVLAQARTEMFGRAGGEGPSASNVAAPLRPGDPPRVAPKPRGSAADPGE